MTCSCNEQNKEQDDNGNGNGHDCGSDQQWDAEAGKCVAKTKTEQIGDPKTQSTQGDMAPAENGAALGDVQQVDPGTCGDNEKWDATTQMCVPTDQKDPGDGQTQGTDKTASIERKLLNKMATQVANLEKKLIGETSKKPLAHVGMDGSTTYKRIDEIANEYVNALRNYGKYEFNIPLEYFRSVTVANSNGAHGVREVYRNSPLHIREAYNQPNKVIKETLKEVVSISGTHATQDLDTDVAIVPGGVSFVPVFQFAKVKQIQQGFDRARFFKTTLPANGSQTVGSTPTEATQTLTSVEVTPSTITGVYLIGDYDEIENSPFDLLQAIVEAAAASYDDFVATDMLTTVSAEGTLTPGLWIRGDTGATITSSDIDSDPFDETGVAFGREYLEDQGYLRGGIKPVLAMHPQQWRELITSSNVTSLATRSVPDIWLKAQLEEFMGVQLVVTNAIEAVNNQTFDAYNAYMFVPKHSYGIGVKRDVTVKFHDIGEDNQVRVNTTWRTKTGVIDASSIVRISTEQ